MKPKQTNLVSFSEKLVDRYAGQDAGLCYQEATGEQNRRVWADRTF